MVWRQNLGNKPDKTACAPIGTDVASRLAVPQRGEGQGDDTAVWKECLTCNETAARNWRRGEGDPTRDAGGPRMGFLGRGGRMQ